MKKNIFYIIIILVNALLFTNISFADQCSKSCTIQYSPAKVLEEYIKNNRAVVQNISGKLKSSDDNILIREVSKVYNTIITWDSFSTGVEFLKLNLKGEIPYPIKRDLQLLEKEGKYLNNFLKRAIENGQTNSPIENVCSGNIPNCNLSGNASDVIGKLIKNHKHMINFYRLSILGRGTESQKKIILVKDNFKSQLNNYYNKYTIADCSQCKGEFKERIQKSLSIIAFKDKAGKDGIKEWKRAWDLLIGGKNVAAEYADKERELLKKELSRQGVNAENGAAVLNNLERYNNTGYAGDNNPIDNSFNTFKNSVDSTGAKQIVSTFFQTIGQIYDSTKGYLSGEKETIPINEISIIESHVTTSINIMNNLDSIYEREMAFIANQDLNNDKLQARIIQMHIDLSQAINILDKTIKFSEKVCNDQDKGNGKCKY